MPGGSVRVGAGAGVYIDAWPRRIVVLVDCTAGAGFGPAAATPVVELAGGGVAVTTVGVEVGSVVVVDVVDSGAKLGGAWRF